MESDKPTDGVERSTMFAATVEWGADSEIGDVRSIREALESGGYQTRMATDNSQLLVMREECDDELRADGSGRPEDGVERLFGTYEYRGDGEWYLIKEPPWDDVECDFFADSIDYIEVPEDVRERAYESFDGERTFIEPNGKQTTGAEAEQAGGRDD